MNSKKVLLIILDGYGIGNASQGNAIELAQKPTIDAIRHQAISSKLVCSGEAVGLPKGQMGNSEVGHLNLGAGRIVYQDISRIGNAIDSGEFFTNPVLKNALIQAKTSSLHLMGLLSDGGVHSDISHLEALIKAAKTEEVPHVWLDLFLDGRDTEPKSALKYLRQLEKMTNHFKLAKVATLAGRYYGMDRDKHWDRVKKSYDAIVHGKGKIFSDPYLAIQDAYEHNQSDEFIEPCTICDTFSHPSLNEDDVMIFFNFRADRAREITLSLTDPQFKGFERSPAFLLKQYYCMVPYDETFNLPVLFNKEYLNNTLGETISRENKTQLRIAETEKYAHVTFFFNGGKEEAFPGEDRVLIPSPRVSTYDHQPSMSAFEVTDELLQRLSNNYDFVLLNFANLDMVGHTGNISAAIKAVETVDACLGKIIPKFKNDYHIIITSDHGNAEDMLDSDGNIQTAHSLNPVPFWVLPCQQKPIKLKNSGYLRDVADVVLHLMEIHKPEEMKESRLVA